MAQPGLTTTVLDAGLTAMVADLNTAGLATGDPGSAGTTDPSSVTTKEDLTWGTAASAVIAITNTPEWTDWTGTNDEEVSWITLWATGGTFGGSMELGEEVEMGEGDSLSLTEVQISSAAAIAS